MHVVGARFADNTAAAAALAEIRGRVAVAPGDVGVRPIGSTDYEVPARGFVLAGRFADDDVPIVVQIAEANGGLIIERRLEWSHARRGARRGAAGAASADGGQQRCLV